MEFMRIGDIIYSRRNKNEKWGFYCDVTCC